MTALRSFLSWLLAAVACLLAVVALAATWMNHQVMSTDQWTATSVQVLRDPQVQELTAGFLADQLVQQGAATAAIQAALPPALQGLGGAATAAFGEVAERAALQALQQRALEDVWAEASRSTHEQFVRWLRGEDVRRTGDIVELDLQPAIVRLAQRVGIPQAAIDAAAVASGGATVQLVGAGQYEQTRGDARRLERAASAALPLAALAALLSILVATRRRGAIVRVGAAAIVAGAVVLIGAPELQTRLMDGLIEGGAARPVARAILDYTTPDLIRAAWLTVVGGAVAVFLALATRRARPVPHAVR